MFCLTAQRNMSEIITDCCGRGVSFASMGQNCSGMAGLPDISYENRAKCEAVFMSCCHQQRDSVSCDEGILLRLSDGDCDLFPQQESCSYSAGKVGDFIYLPRYRISYLLTWLIHLSTVFLKTLFRQC